MKRFVVHIILRIWDALCMSLGVYRIPADDEHEQTIIADKPFDGRNKMKRVNREEFLKKYVGYIPAETCDRLCVSWDKYSLLTEEEYEQTINAKKAVDDFNKALAKAAELNNKGIAHEKAGELKEAIACYEENILPEAYVSMHPYTRLTILYRKAKEYNEELRVIETGLAQIQWAAEKEKLEKRREKVIELINKNNQ